MGQFVSGISNVSQRTYLVENFILFLFQAQRIDQLHVTNVGTCNEYECELNRFYHSPSTKAVHGFSTQNMTAAS